MLRPGSLRPDLQPDHLRKLGISLFYVPIFPQGLKPQAHFWLSRGTAEAVPFKYIDSIEDSRKYVSKSTVCASLLP